MHRRHWLALMPALALTGLAGCGTQPPGAVDDSLLSYARTFDAAHGAMADQKLTIVEQDRRNGRIEGTLDGDTIVATLALQHDGSIRVRFTQQGQKNPELLKRVVDAYNERIRGAARLLPPSS